MAPEILKHKKSKMDGALHTKGEQKLSRDITLKRLTIIF
jgi:hypothetical protein